MQVSQIENLDTHAVIGGGKAQAFGMSDSAEFFTVLSDTLYRDKKRAVIREVVCNGWDSHIKAGKTDLAIQVTLTDEELIIRDFGVGIPKNLIVPIYCVYGGSTKVKDETQTGGFGLGSKAPFAYTDHFTVTSSCEGSRSVYAISRGGEATGGKPDIRTMVEVPTKDTGITVSIPLRQASDRAEFEAILRQVVYQGGMKVELNGGILPTLDYTEARATSFMMVKPERTAMREASVYVLYGTVLYPVTTTDIYITGLVADLGKLVEHGAKLILIAPPNSLGVTPSREALSYSDITTKTIRDLLNDTIRKLKSQAMPAVVKLVEEAATKMSRYNAGATIIATGSNHNEPILATADPAVIVSRAVKANINSYLLSADRRRMMLKRAVRKFPDSRRYFRRSAAGVSLSTKGRWEDNDASAEQFRHTSRLLLRMASKLGLLSKLYAIDGGRDDVLRVKRIDEIAPRGQVAPMVIVAPNQRDFQKEVRWLRTKIRDGRNMTWTAFIIGKPHDQTLDAVASISSHYGLPLTLLTFPQVKKEKQVKTKRLAEFYALSGVRKNSSGYHLKMPAEPTLEKPKFYVMGKGTSSEFETGWMRVISDQGDALNRLFPNTAICTTIKQEAKLKAAGAKPLAEGLFAELNKLGKSREVQYFYLIQSGRIVVDDHSYSQIKSTLKNLIAWDDKIARMLFPERQSSGAKADRARELVAIVEAYQHYRSYSEHDFNKLKDVWERDLVDMARKTFAHLVIKSTKEVNQRFAWLRALHSHSPSNADREYLREVVRMLKRKFDVAPNPATEEARIIEERRREESMRALVASAEPTLVAEVKLPAIIYPNPMHSWKEAA